MFAGDQTNLDLAAQFGLWCGDEKNCIQQNVRRHHDDGSDKERARNIAFRISYFANDVTGRVPAGVGIHYVDKRDRECAAEDRHRVGSLR